MIDTKALRSKILDAAIRGQLTQQLPKDGTAEELYQQIQKEKQKLIKAGKIKKEKPLPEIKEEDIPFEIPENWKWVRLGEVGSWHAGATPLRGNTDYYNGNIPWLKTGDLNDNYITEVSESITNQALDECSLQINPVGSVLIAMYGATIGKLGIANIPLTTNQACCACVLFNGVYNKFLFYFLMSMRKNFVKMGIGGAQSNISKEKIIKTVFPLPPLAEQRRIVEKVDLIFSLLDKIDMLQKCLVDNFAVLKSKLIDAAIQGKLTEQLPEDGTSEELYQQIQKERKRQELEGTIKTDELVSEIDKTKIPFSIPSNWKWTCLGNVSYIVRGGSPRPIKQYITTRDDGINWIKIGDVEKGGKYIYSTHEKIIPEGEAKSRRVYPGDFLLTNSMSFGRPYISKIEGCIHDGWLLIHDFNGFIPDYLYYLLSSKYLYSQFTEKASGSTVNNLNIDKVKAAIIPLPPLSEQRRIVERLDELLEFFSS